MDMGRRNQSLLTEFILLDFVRSLEEKTLLFLLFFLVYVVTLTGNLTIIMAVGLDPRLHTPMYFFLCQLSCLDICYSSVTVPKILQNLSSTQKTISVAGCITQMYFFLSFATTEFLLLTVMAYDRYVAVCNPLRYHLVMNLKFCVRLSIGPWLASFLISLLHAVGMSKIIFCGPGFINQYFCDLPPLLALSCVDTLANVLTVFMVNGVMGLGSLSVTLISYVYIVGTILKIQSAEGKRKTFSSCGSHLTVVCLSYATAFFTYLRPTSSYSQEKDRLIPLLYGVGMPMVNPLIYSLRNRDVKRALKKGIGIRLIS
ncbi:olfactory receptor 5V1-like [Rhinatrema bivittatum]|uniref:olfactory receptor 5V1-like n=1 Tax=Rhinatrema bivittatum TaxID=194408 RepID=UPI00112A744E|nr:olfactory receptor 5V1-like [Rhinatrema bivittatum]